MLRKALTAVVLLASAGTFLVAQGPHRHTPPPVLLRQLLQPNAAPAPATVSGLPSSAAGFDATRLGSPLVLDSGWRVGISRDPQAASPDFDDSSWPIRTAAPEIAEVPHPDVVVVRHARTFAWFRLHIHLPANHGPLALLIELPVSQNSNFFSLDMSEGPAVEVFADGQRITPDGPHADDPQPYAQITRLYRLDVPASETSLTLALRTFFIPNGFDSYTSFFARHTIELGTPDDLQKSVSLWYDADLFERIPRLVNSVLDLFLALFLFALYGAQRGHVEYLWLAVYELVEAPLAFLLLAGSTARLDEVWASALLLQLFLISLYLFFEFIVSLLALRRRWPILLLRFTAPVLVLVGPCMLLGLHNSVIAVIMAALLLWCALWFVGWFLFVCVTLVRAALRRNFEAGLLLIPLFFRLVGIIEPVLTGGMARWTGHPYYSPLTISAGPMPIHFDSIADFTGIIVIVLIIFVRFLRIQREQERASNELAAARNVQEMMIPREPQDTPGYQVDSIYNPANEVGGDFYHVQPASDGSLLVVVGDVAGKGMTAAMNVSMLMGALRRMTERSPAKLLEALNGVLSGSDSFTTCQAALFGPQGEVTLANAGHLSPYLNSQEIELVGGLPLGALPDGRYEEIHFYLHPGDRLLMLSDGVVEARRPSGELFGFDRVRNLSNQSAFYIADAAKAFGQQDDITVLTVRRLVHAKAA